jgi:hypothetical protein
MDAQITYTGSYVGPTRKRRIVSEVRVEHTSDINGHKVTMAIEAISEPLTLAKSKSWSWRTVDVLRSQIKGLAERINTDG